MTPPQRRQLILALTLICHSSLRGVVELLRDVFDCSISLGTVHNVLQAAYCYLLSLEDHRDADTWGVRLLELFLNHRRFLRSEWPERVGKSPAELRSGSPHPHWLEMLGHTRFSRL